VNVYRFGGGSGDWTSRRIGPDGLRYRTHASTKTIVGPHVRRSLSPRCPVPDSFLPNNAYRIGVSRLPTSLPRSTCCVRSALIAEPPAAAAKSTTVTANPPARATKAEATPPLDRLYGASVRLVDLEQLEPQLRERLDALGPAPRASSSTS
jgi:hypothetical protein